MATHFSILTLKISWTGEPGRLQSMGSKELDTTERLTLSLLFHRTQQSLHTYRDRVKGQSR